MNGIIFDAGSYDLSGRALAETGSGLRSEAEAFFASVGDVASLGTNDLLGGVCQAVYAVALAAVASSVSSAAESYEEYGDKLLAAGRVYRDLESGQVAAAGGMVG